MMTVLWFLVFYSGFLNENIMNNLSTGLSATFSPVDKIGLLNEY